MTTTLATQRSLALTWRRLVVVAAAGDLVLLFAQGLVRQDWEALVVAAVMVVGAGLLCLRRGGLAGLLVLAVSFANLVVWMLPAALSNASHRQGLIGMLLAAALAACSLAGLLASLAAILRRSDQNQTAGGKTARWAGLGAVGVVAVALLAAAVVGPGPAQPPAGAGAGVGGLALEFSNTAYRPAALTAPAGEVTVLVTNRDLFWHSFTVDELAVNVDVPVGGTRQVSLRVPPGSYEFYCRVPGHRQAGMVGMLRVN